MRVDVSYILMNLGYKPLKGISKKKSPSLRARKIMEGLPPMEMSCSKLTLDLEGVKKKIKDCEEPEFEGVKECLNSISAVKSENDFPREWRKKEKLLTSKANSILDLTLKNVSSEYIMKENYYDIFPKISKPLLLKRAEPHEIAERIEKEKKSFRKSFSDIMKEEKIEMVIKRSVYLARETKGSRDLAKAKIAESKEKIRELKNKIDRSSYFELNKDLSFRKFLEKNKKEGQSRSSSSEGGDEGWIFVSPRIEKPDLGLIKRKNRGEAQKEWENKVKKIEEDNKVLEGYVKEYAIKCENKFECLTKAYDEIYKEIDEGYDSVNRELESLYWSERAKS